MDLARDAEEVAGQLDGLVAPADEPENAVLVDNARVVRWAGPAFALFSLILLPWIAYLAYSLPARQVSADYDVAWAGFDVMLLAALAAGVELPLAAVCVWLGLHTQQLAERRLVLLLRRGRKTEARSR